MLKKNTSRKEKVAAEVKKTVSEYLIHNSSSSDAINSALITVTDVVMSPCLQHAKIYIIPVSNSVSHEKVLSFLSGKVPLLRKHVASAIRMKYVPDFRFFIDDSFEYAEKIEQIFSKLR